MRLNVKRKWPSILLGICGLLLITVSLYPIVEYEYTSRKKFPSLVSPLSKTERDMILSAPFKNYGILGNWSSEYELEKAQDSYQDKYFISIPRLTINEAEVFVGGEDLSKSLIQYPGTAQPGKIGNTVIFGHSVLPIFFNPKNYMTIFSTLPKLKKGDEIIVKTEDVLYKYEVDNMYEVLPNNLNILDQRLDNSYLSLVTCVPPGHPLKPKRLVVRAKLTHL